MSRRRAFSSAGLVALVVGALIAPCAAVAQVRQSATSLAQSTQDDHAALPQFIDALPDVTARMKVIQGRSQLMITRSNVVRTAIADERIVDIAQYSPTELAIIGLVVGRTTVTYWFEDSPRPLISLVEVIADPSLEEQRHIDHAKLEGLLAELFPRSRIHLVPLRRKIVVTGQACSAEEALQIVQVIAGEVMGQNGDLCGPAPGRSSAAGPGSGTGPQHFDPRNSPDGNGLSSSGIVNMLTVRGESQIALRVRVAELKRSTLRRMGINFNLLINDSSQFFGSTASGGTGARTGVFSACDVMSLIDAFELNGTARILAEPTITVLSGHSASFLSGGEMAVPTIVENNGGGQQTTFRGFGVSLVVVPTLRDRDLIRMQIFPEFSGIDSSIAVNGIPGTNTRRMQTTVELREGQTIALAGLIAYEAGTRVARIPLIGQIPLIGPLFCRDKRDCVEESELLILVTPEIIRPRDAEDLPPGLLPVLPPATRGDRQEMPPDRQGVPRPDPNSPRGSPRPINPGATDQGYDGHASGSSLKNRVVPAGHRTTRKPPLFRSPASEQTDSRGTRGAGGR